MNYDVLYMYCCRCKLESIISARDYLRLFKNQGGVIPYGYLIALSHSLYM